MKEQNILDIIVYLLETTTAQQTNIAASQKLEKIGFNKKIIARTFDWLNELMQQQSWYSEFPNVNTNKTLRIFSLEETCKINLEIRGFILLLEHVGVLDTKMREIVINQLMQLNKRSINLIDAKWVVFFVLISKSNNTDQMRSYLLTTMTQKG